MGNEIKIELSKVSVEEVMQLNEINKVHIYLEGNEGKFDVGSWCYKKRRKRKVGNNDPKKFIRIVDDDDLDLNKVEFIRHFIIFLIDAKALKHSIHYIRGYIYKVRIFINWCDTSKSVLLNSNKNRISAYREYTSHLEGCVFKGVFRASTAAANQSAVRHVLSSIVSDEEYRTIEYIPKLPKRRNDSTPTIPPSQEEAAEAISTYTTIFETFTQFLLGFEKYPFEIKLSVDKYSCFPCDFLCFGSMSQAWDREHRTGQSKISIDFGEKKVCGIDEIIFRRAQLGKSVKRSYIIAARKSIITRIYDENNDRYSKTRLYLARMAVGVFVSLFIANTGMNVTQVIGLEWSENYQVAKREQNFRAVKWRANGKEVSFVTGFRFNKLFLQYLKLRTYLESALPDKETSSLFFFVAKNKFVKIDPKYSFRFAEKINSHFGINVHISPKRWRAFKSHYLLKNVSVADAADSLQNEKSTLLRHYTGQYERAAADEMDSFLSDYRKKVLSSKLEKTMPVPVGQCIDYQRPNAESIDPRIVPDCKSVEGCFYCKHYFVHADVIDIRKLLSFKYILLANKPLTDDQKKENKLLDDVLVKVDMIVSAIMETRHVSNAQLLKIRSEVFSDEILSPYWQDKLSLLIDLDYF